MIVPLIGDETMNDNNESQFLLYTAPNGAVRIEVCFRGETVWLTQAATISKMEIVRNQTYALSTLFQ
jgi:hypothetical protein